LTFKIQERKTYPWTVEHVVAVVAGKPELMKFDAEFKALPQSRIEEMMKLAQADKLNNDSFLTEVLVGWHGLVGEDGAEFVYDKTNLDKMTQLYPGVVGSIVRAYMESIIGAARKN